MRAMDAREVAIRARRAIGSRADAGSLNVAPRLWRRTWEPSSDRILTNLACEDAPLGFIAPERVREAAAVVPDVSARLLLRAEAALDGRVRFFGYPEVRLDDSADLELDPFTGLRWPDAHGKLLNYRRAGAGDPKWIWELNRCQELPLLCLAWHLSGEVRFAKAAHDRVLAWIGGSRPGRGIAWSNGFEAGLRGVSFALTFDALRGSGLFEEEEAELVLRGLWQHARWIVRDRSFGSSANNHLIGEAAGLVVLGLLAPELKESGRWVERGVRWLENEADRQILPDGGGAEQAFAYHLFVCDLLLLVAALLEVRGAALPLRIEAALRRSADALALQVRPGEPDPAYGDSDDGRAFLFDCEETRTASAVAASLACGVGHAAAAHLAGAPDFPAVLLFGDAGARRFAKPEGGAKASGVLPDTGLVVLRRNGARLSFDVGPLGYLKIAAHGHADGLAVTYSEGARELISDPGTGTYFGDRERRHAFRSTAAHATVSVDGNDQAVYGGPFLWLQHSAARLLFVDLETGYAAGEIGWSRLPDPVRHRRAVFVLPGGALLVYDRLDARLRHRYAQTWPLHPSLELRSRTASVFEAFVDGRSWLLAAVAPSDARVRTIHGRVEVSEGWWSRRLEQVEPAWTMRVEQERAGRTEFAALFVPTRGAELDEPRLQLEREGTAAIASFALDGRWRVGFDLDAPESPVRMERDSE
ncbi:MAG: alginate lyase family protein [Gaiellaceae bacterium]